MELLLETRALLADYAAPWAICGGYALELFAGQTIRPHGDIDLCIMEQNRADIIAYLLDRDWRILEYRGMGRVKPIRTPADSESGRSLMALLDDCPLVEFFPSEEEGIFYHRFHHTGMDKLNFLDLLFSREEEGSHIFSPGITRERCDAVLLREGIPVLAPEIALLHKAARPDETSTRLDFDSVYPLMNTEQQSWLQDALAALYPGGHPWNRP